MSHLQALIVLRHNISALLVQHKQSQTDLASWLQHDKSWINKFLNGEREIQLKDLDRIADFFGLAAYQLFQPGVSERTERRAGVERRAGRDRRVSHQTRLARELEGHLHPQRKASHGPSPLRDLVGEFEARLSRLLSQAESRGQAPVARARVAKPSARPRVPSRSDPEET